MCWPARPPIASSKPFKELCGLIKDDADYIQFLRALMAALCNLMLNMYTMIQWHERPLYERPSHALRAGRVAAFAAGGC